MPIVRRLAAGWWVDTVAAEAGVTARTVRLWRCRHPASTQLLPGGRRDDATAVLDMAATGAMARRIVAGR